MSTHVISVTEDTGIDEVARLLAGERIRRVPVIKRGKMVGLLSRSDVLDFFAKTRWTCAVCGRWERGLERQMEDKWIVSKGKSYSSVEEHAVKARPRLACSSLREHGSLLGMCSRRRADSLHPNLAVPRHSYGTM